MELLLSCSSVERLSILLEFRLGDYSIYLAMIGTEINTSVQVQSKTFVIREMLDILLGSCVVWYLVVLSAGSMAQNVVWVESGNVVLSRVFSVVVVIGWWSRFCCACVLFWFFKAR